MKRKCPAPRRGPARCKTSDRKMTCCCKSCRSGRDVKNVPPKLRAHPNEVDKTKCRPLRPTIQQVHFCCENHKKQCLKKTASNPRGQRECLDQEQCRSLWACLVNKVQCPWAAVLMMVQLCLGERAGAACCVLVSWLQNILENNGNPSFINIPEDVNGKTKSRSVPILAEFASMLRQWMLTSPLKAPNGSQWPFAEQPLGPDCCLFPGHKISKGRELHRTWTQPITTRAFLYKIGEAAAILQRERANRHEEGLPSIWDDVDLSKLGTHSIKRTCVSLLKDQCRSGAVVSAICGTTAATLDRVYDTPTARRQRAALKVAVGPVLGSVEPAAAFCNKCQKQRGCQSWFFCPYCGKEY